MRNKSTHEIQASLEAIRKQMATLNNERMRHEVLQQFQRQGVTRPDSRGFVTGNGVHRG